MEHKEHWLDKERFRVYPRILLTAYLVIGFVWVLHSTNMVDPMGKPLGYDFITFWSASHLGLAGHPEGAYNIPLLFKTEQLAVPASEMVFAWYYPPTFYLVILPLALLPYIPAYFLFMLLTLSGYLLLMKRVICSNEAVWCLLAFSGLWANFFHGQNAFLTATLAGAALLCLETRPLLAGVFVGLLSIKPHLAALFPLALLAIGAWRTFFTAGAVAILFFTLATAVLGSSVLEPWLASLGNAKMFLEIGALPLEKMPTTFAFLRLLDLPIAASYAGHLVVAVAAAFAVWKVWRHSTAWPLRNAALITANLMVSPYLFDYDLAWLALPIAWLAMIGWRQGWLQGEREVLVAAWLLPLLMAPIVKLVPIQIGPIVLLGLLWIILRRAYLEKPRLSSRGSDTCPEGSGTPAAKSSPDPIRT